MVLQETEWEGADVIRGGPGLGQVAFSCEQGNEAVGDLTS